MDSDFALSLEMAYGDYRPDVADGCLADESHAHLDPQWTDGF